MSVLTAERIKLTSTRSPWWCSASVVVIGLGIAALFAGITRATLGNPDAQPDMLSVGNALSGVSGLGVMVLMILATLTVTSEYRFGIIRTTFLATPNRSAVVIAKALLTAALAAVLTLVLAFAAFALAKVIAGDEAGYLLVIDGNLRPILGVPVYAALCAILAVGVGFLLRQSAAAISLLILWPLLVESLLSAFGSFGRTVGPFLPFANANRFLGAGDTNPDYWHWNVWVSLLYFAVFVAVIFGAAMFVVNKRDA